MKKTLIKALIFSSVFGLIFGAYFLYIGLSHNSQGEFISDSGQIDVVYCIQIFLVWYLVGAIVGVLAFCLGNGALKIWRAN